jgi:hypothetical protein
LPYFTAQDETVLVEMREHAHKGRPLVPVVERMVIADAKCKGRSIPDRI